MGRVRLATLWRTRQPALPGITAVARVDRRTRQLVKRLRPGDIAIIDHVDIDRLAAESLVECGVAAVVNAATSISGRYPNLGPEILVANGIPLLDGVGTGVLADVRDGDIVRLYEGSLYAGDRVVAAGEQQTIESVQQAMADARTGLAVQLEAFAANTMEYLRRDRDLLLDGVGVPEIATELAGKQVLVVVRGYNHREDLAALRRYIRAYRPVLIGVDAGADVLLESGYRPAMVLGDLDSLSNEALRSGAEIVVRTDPDGRAPDLDRIHDLGLTAVEFAASGTTEDAALLLADAKGAALIATAGTHATLAEFLDKGRSGMASTFLTRLRVGGKLVDAKSVNRLYRSRFSTSVLAWFAFVVVLAGAVVSTGLVVRNHDLKAKRAEVSQLHQQVQALQTHGARLQSEVDAGAAFANGAEPLAVAGRLTGEPVVLIVAPNAPNSVLDATVKGLADAGATLTGVIDLRPSFVDPAQVANLGELATSLGATAPSQNVAAQASALLASALVGQATTSSAGRTLDATSTEILAGFAQGGFISMLQVPAQHARLAVIVAPTPAAPASGSTATAAASRNALVDLVAAFPAAGGTTVVAGASGSAANGGLLAALRAGGASSAGTAAVSTVDDADGPAGSVAVIMALQAEQAQPGSSAAVGHYGNGPGARAALPAPPPT
ncbi:MAG TPA: putative cytokinetic ring protein SteA [Acidothermaceae bacterium]|nr:putative cytokinetic ring protein SteA [Acidothermaceae bacterium]